LLEANTQPAAGGQDICLRGAAVGLERVERALAPDVTVWAVACCGSVPPTWPRG